MKKQFLVAIGIVLGTMVVMNVVMYWAFLSIALFRVHAAMLSLIMVLLSGNLILVMAVSRRSASRLMRIYYDASMMWMGIFGYLFLASVVYLVVALITGRAIPLVALLLLGGVGLMVIYARIHAQTLVTTYVPVTLKNLPEVWRGRKAVLVSDVHIGLIQDGDFIRGLVEKVNALRPDIVFIAGDLFDGSALPEILEYAKPLKDLSAKLGVYFVSGNHEEYGDVPAFVQSIVEAGIHPLDEQVITIDGVQFIGTAFADGFNAIAFEQQLASIPLDPMLPTILLKHEPRHLAVVEQKGISLQLSGHTHNGQIWPIGYLTRLVYKRFTYGLQRFGTLQVYTSSGAGTWGPRMRIGSNSEIAVFEFR